MEPIKEYTYICKAGGFEHTLYIMALSVASAGEKLVYMTAQPSDWELIDINDDIF